MVEREQVNPVIIAYYKPDQEVLWWVEGYDRDVPKTQLYARMQDYIANGNTFTILEYHPNGWHGKTDEDTLGERAAWWDKRLREQGYDIYDPGKEYDDDIEGN